MINYSLVLPSRERPKLLEKLLTNIQVTTANLSEIELLCAVDNDDTATLAELPRLIERFSFAKFIVGKQSHNLSLNYYTKLALPSSGRYVQVLNDDATFATSQWDALALPVLDEYKAKFKDGAIYGRVEDVQWPARPYACFPILSREALTYQGFFFHQEFCGHGADMHLFNIWTKLDRVVTVPYRMWHVQAHDATNKHIHRISTYNWNSAAGEANRIGNIMKSKQ